MLNKLLNSTSAPFRSTPDARFYFDHPSIEAARQTVLRALIRAEGPAVVMGGTGYGKSLLADLVADQLCERMDVVILQSARLASRRAMLQNILFELRMPYRELSEGELRLSILDRLEPSPETAPEGVLVIVDEAHTLHWKLIDELRLISNFTRNHQPRVKLLLLGNMKLEDTLTSPQLDSFNQRLAARCYLQPMSRTETCAYVQHQIRLCDVDPAKVLTQDALQSVFAASEGVPRLVNQLMNHAIWMASNSAQAPISASLINDAWRDLQQLPTPWTTSQVDKTNANGSIEFAELSDDVDDSSESVESWNSEVKTNEPSENVFQIVNYAADVKPASVQAPTTQVVTQQSTSPEVSEYQFSDSDSNFFAAFSPSPTSQYLSELDSSSEDDGWRIRVEADKVKSVSKPEEPTTATALPLSAFGNSSTNWFQPTAIVEPVVLPNANDVPKVEHDRMIGLIAEQQQYDSMGVWENDPPLTGRTSLGTTESLATSPTAHPLFGNDFDEEVLVSSKVEFPSPATSASTRSTALQSSSQKAPQTGSVPTSADASTNYILRMQQFAEALTTVANTESKSSETTNANLQAQQNHLPTHSQRSNPLTETLWSIDVNTNISSTGQVEEAIEDIVSQLNFSALSVEPFSVEQIPLTAPTKAVPADSIRRGQNDQVYLMHRPNLLDQHLAVEDFDDDRDLLVVEEEVPVSSRMLDGTISEHPAQKTTSYSQLFARLRK